MDGKAKDQRWGWGWPASAAVHAIVAALVVFGLPSLPEQPPEEEVISVTLEPPPEPAEPETAEEVAPAATPPAVPQPVTAEEAPPETPEPEEAEADPKAEPEPPAAPETVEEAAALPPPPPETAEQTVPPEQPQPPVPPDQQPGQQAAAAPIRPLDPVVRFGETESGLRQSLDGGAAEDDPAAGTPATPHEEPDATDAAEAGDAAEPANTAEAEPGDGGAPLAAQPDGTDGAADALVASIVAAPDKAPPQGTGGAEPEPGPELREARTLFSRAATGDPMATTAMAGIPRGIRAGRLCATELRLQLLASSLSPDLLPSYRLDEGNVLRVTRGAFRAGGTWRNLGFECQVDADATSVRSFAFRIGDPVLRDEAARRGLPVE